MYNAGTLKAVVTVRYCIISVRCSC